MLNVSNTHRRPPQSGIALLIALVVLVILSLASVGLMRTVTTSNVVAGNLAFQQAALTSADQGVETAVQWLENNLGQSASSTAIACASAVGSTVLACNQTARGYAASRQDPGTTEGWGDLWATLVAAGYQPVALAQDSAGNTVSYLVQRMCAAEGDASSSIGCSAPPASTECGSSKTLDSNSGAGNLTCTSQSYFRITVQVTGPRNTLAYTQAMVAL